MENEKIKLLGKGIEKLKATVKETNELITKLEEEKKKAEMKAKVEQICKSPEARKDFVENFFKFTDDVLAQIEREMARSQFFVKITLSNEEDSERAAKAKRKKKEDMVRHPSHYQGKMECIDAMEKEFGKTAVEWFCLLNAFKYEYRKDKKNAMREDQKKRDWYINKFNDLRKGKNVPKATPENLEKTRKQVQAMRIRIGNHCYRSVQASDVSRACDECDIYKDTVREICGRPVCFLKEYERASEFCENRAEEDKPICFKRVY